jgi:hypothetical protein
MVYNHINHVSSPELQRTPPLITAYQFTTHLELDSLLTHLSEHTECKWYAKSSGYYGDYISATMPQTRTVFRVFQRPEPNNTFAFDMKNKGETKKKWDEEVANFIKCLETIGAKDFLPTEHYY